MKESKEHQKMFQDMEILKKTEERYRNQTKKLQKDLNDLAVVSGEDKQQQENNLKILLDQKEQFEKCKKTPSKPCCSNRRNGRKNERTPSALL